MKEYRQIAKEAVQFAKYNCPNCENEFIDSWRNVYIKCGGCGEALEISEDGSVTVDELPF